MIWKATIMPNRATCLFCVVCILVLVMITQTFTMQYLYIMSWRRGQRIQQDGKKGLTTIGWWLKNGGGGGRRGGVGRHDSCQGPLASARWQDAVRVVTGMGGRWDTGGRFFFPKVVQILMHSNGLKCTWYVGKWLDKSVNLENHYV